MAGSAINRKKQKNIKSRADARKRPVKRTAALRERRINIRATPQQEMLIREAAQIRGENLTDFILRTACHEATSELMETRQYILSPEKWRLFLEELDKPPIIKPALRRIFSELSILERNR